MKKYILKLADDMDITDEEIDIIEEKFKQFLYDPARRQLIIGPGVSLYMLDTDDRVEDVILVTPDGENRRVEKFAGLPSLPPSE
jgi:hypothetical protein